MTMFILPPGGIFSARYRDWDDSVNQRPAPRERAVTHNGGVIYHIADRDFD